MFGQISFFLTVSRSTEVIIINKKNYKAITDFFKSNKRANKILKISYKLLPAIIFVSYPLMLIYIFIFQQKDLFSMIIIPAGVFALVTVLRKLINRKRPYEVYDIPSVFKKETVGNSMPSRHTASALIISLAMLKINAYLGIAFLFISLLILLSRIFAGVHFISDVIAGATISIVAGIIFFFILL